MKETNENRKRPERYWLFILIGAVAGLGLGWLYFYFVGCRTGACPLRANPYYNMLLGALIGYIVSDWIVMAAFKRKSRDKHDL
jgi:uncharacterized membrane protein